MTLITIREAIQAGHFGDEKVILQWMEFKVRRWCREGKKGRKLKHIKRSKVIFLTVKDIEEFMKG